MDIAAYPVFFSSNNKCYFTVSFQPHQTIDNMTARFLQLLCPDDIVFLVKPCLQFHQNGNLLSVLRRLLQRRDNGGIAADSVERLLDRQNLRISRRLPNEPYHRLKALVGVMHENIALPDPFKHIRVLRQLRYRLGWQIAVLLQVVKTFHTIELHQKGKIQRSADGINIFFGNGQLLPDQLQEPAVDSVLHLQTDHLSPLSLL